METRGDERAVVKQYVLPQKSMSTNCRTFYKMAADAYLDYTGIRVFFPLTI